MSWNSVHSSWCTLSIWSSPLNLFLTSTVESQGVWFRSYLNDLVVLPTLFNFSLNWAIRSSWPEAQSAPGLVFANCCKEYNQSDFGVDHLVMSMCRVFSCVVGRGCLLWPVHFLGKILLVFALFHSAFQGQICLSLQVFLDFLLLHFSPLYWKGHLFGC